MDSETNKGNRGKKCILSKKEFFNQLVVEFQTTKSEDAKKQVLANLANFAYDPRNYRYFRELNILDLFLDNLYTEEDKIVEFSLGGICNLCSDPEINKLFIIRNGLKQIIKHLDSENEKIKLYGVTILMFLVTSNSKSDIISDQVIKSMLGLSKDRNTRLRNLATIFLEDHCAQDRINELSKLSDIEGSNPHFSCSRPSTSENVI